ncbi:MULTISPECIES: PACE efflux transporter [Methylotenera]|uniref:PACE efflux transporter n=1 Tax=Methylotenera TaxID=359407 RepID=UPI00037DBB6E|nr:MULTISPECIES: PACE efflux transporter [Methylotenera]
MTPTTRRVVQALLYELGAIALISPIIGFAFDASASSALTLAAIMSTIALAWNYVFNAIFERWESRQIIKGRSVWRRLAHGIGFEGGLVTMLVPLMAYWLNISLLNAFYAEMGILLVFFIYAITFTWAFDKIFGLPESAISHPDKV